MITTVRTISALAFCFTLLAAAACGSGAVEEGFPDESAMQFPGAPAPAAPAAAVAPMPAPAMRAQASEGFAVAAPPPLPPSPPRAEAAAPAPAASFSRGAPVAPAPTVDVASSVQGSFLEQEVAALVTQQRIIVRTVDMSIVVSDVPTAVDGVAELARELGGWMVTTDRSEKHFGFVAIRVPADRLDEAVLRLRKMAVEVESEVSGSRDVTDEYFDIKARLENQQATEQALRRLLDRAEKVQDALKVQQALTQVQEDIERHLGRIKLLEETSAFSLINVSLRLEHAEMSVDGGLERTVSVGEVARFRATFLPPEGIDEFTHTWDFGDGTPAITSRTTSPTPDDAARVTETIRHVYSDERDSPFFVEVKITGTGDAGVAEGEHTIRVNVVESADIPIDAGPDQASGVGELIRFRATFEPPERIDSFVFTWDFGDGSGLVSSDRTSPTEEEGKRVTATMSHVYRDERDSPYIAEVKITGRGDAGVAEGEDNIVVTVTKLPTVEVFAGDGRTVEEGEEVEFSGSFTRPEGVSDVRFRWTFGDGSPPETGALKEGDTNAVATHVYPHNRPFPYTATLTITAESDAGSVESSGSLLVRVEESRGWVIAGWSAENQGKTAVRALSAAGQGAVTALIWAAIFSPLWVAAGVVALVVTRRIRGRKRSE